MISMDKLFDKVVIGDTKTVLDAVEKNPKLVYYTNSEKITLLHHSCRIGVLEIVQGLLNKGANINAYSSNYMDPLMYAAFHNHIEVVALLLKHGANPNACYSGCTALGWASDFVNYDVCILLLSKGANLNANHIGHPIITLYGTFGKSKFSYDVLEQQKKSLIAEWNWARRLPFMKVIVEHKYLPLAYFRDFLNSTALSPHDVLEPIDISTKEKYRLYMMGLIFSSYGLLRYIVSFI